MNAASRGTDRVVFPAAPSFAQTNLQLYGQLRRLGYPEEDLARIRAAHDAALPLFVDLYRATGKPFIAHLVGTASVVAEERISVDLLCTALLHSAYTHGDFGNGLVGITEAKRSRIRAVVGARTEEMVARYAAFPWSPALAPEIARSAAAMPELDRGVVLLRLANEVEELVDLGYLYNPDAQIRRQEFVTALPDWIAAARAIGQEGIARRLLESRAALTADPIPEALRSRHIRSFRVTRASLSPTWTTLLHSLMNRARSLGRGVVYRLKR